MTLIYLTDDEVAALRRAIDVFILVEIGRFADAARDVLFSGLRPGTSLTPEEVSFARALLEEAAGVVTGRKSGGPSVFSDAVSDKARLAWRVEARIAEDDTRVAMVDGSGRPTFDDDIVGRTPGDASEQGKTPPTPACVAVAKGMLATMRRMGRAPERVAPAADGGVYFFWRYGHIVVDNDRIVAACVNTRAEIRAWEVGEDGLEDAINRVSGG